ncbi:restriction endonuclease subunit S [Streptomyces sp. NPDC047706]|uniref:restriction endonuclease subunit S n=1 Tax=Streptomyces sp. NPDC047706 TaxID=3365486 RepID=UPI003714B9D0
MRAANVKDGALELADVKSMNFTPAEQQIFSLRVGDVLVTEGSGSLRSVGASAVWRGGVDGVVCFQNTLLRMRPRAGITDGRFLEWWARSAFGSGLFASVATGANIYHISAERVRALPIELPTLEEQRRIADFLDAETAHIDQLLALRERQHQLLMSHRDAQVRAHFRSVDTSPTRLKFLLAARPRYGVLVPKFEDNGVKFIRVNDLLDLPGRAESLITISPEVSTQYPTTVVRTGDVLVSVVGTLGRAAVAPGSVAGANVNRAIAVLRPQPRVDRELLTTWINTADFQEQALLATGNDSAQRTLGMEDMANFYLNWPSESDQRKLALMVQRSIEWSRELSDALKRQSAVMKERRQALITAAVTGQFDVTTASGRNATEGVCA